MKDEGMKFLGFILFFVNFVLFGQFVFNSYLESESNLPDDFCRD
jgi:hypothetical protein